ncbi:regulator of chromosome condensation RCC1 [Chlorella sorokiniana]|uniref:Regulator of chromosome condensation RCC1 n=1 Tax=Chlorella sorokiniana TaxID=3076 RepID=A0A2P6TB54_CHLSO|nr:regulator of chromosome condensation RCC1 [Chlorella sorokiniana]|eukprot:PRW05781.1 regulator of chromosome condensation RCC1 [Chlorella sorokiniana]
MASKPIALGLLCVLAFIGGRQAVAQNITVCWGDGSFGNLGNGVGTGVGDSYQSNVPVEVSGSHLFTAVCTGLTHSCALEASGQAWCWGENTAGYLGNGNNVNSAIPVACWGDNSVGQLGAGVPLTAGAVTESSTPIKVAGSYQYISSAYYHSCAVEWPKSPQAWCWGGGEGGVLGTGSNSDQTAPTAVAGGRDFDMVAAGVTQTCAIARDRSAWCWGVNDNYGKLGDGGVGGGPTPVKVAGDYSFLTLGPSFDRHMCAIATKQAGQGVSPPAAAASPSPSSSPSPSPSTTEAASPSPRLSPVPSSSPALAVPSPSTTTTTTSSSSVPIGAIVGGAAAGAVVLCVLAFLALRPGKGWLLRKPLASGPENGGSSKPASMYDSSSPLPQHCCATTWRRLARSPPCSLALTTYPPATSAALG